MPDFDVDLCMEKRDRGLSTSQTCTGVMRYRRLPHMAAKAVNIRDVRVLGIRTVSRIGPRSWCRPIRE